MPTTKDDPRSLPEWQLTELRRRNAALAAKLEPVVGRLRELLPERRELVALTVAATRRAQAAAEQAGEKQAWAESGEEQFRTDNGSAAANDAVYELSQLVQELDDPLLAPGAGEGALNTAEVIDPPGGWVPTMESVEQLMIEGHAWELRQYADAFRKAITDAYAAATGVFGAAPCAYMNAEDFAEESGSVRGLLGSALLEGSLVAEEALARLEGNGAA